MSLIVIIKGSLRIDFFLVGLKVDNYAQWIYYVSKEILKKEIELDLLSAEMYKKLKNSHDKSMVLFPKKLLSEAFLIEIKGTTL